ncbi:MAG: hypothetical protein QOK47_1587, partial [Actinomycetota bacterium]|nr:hypothetical protein [Actinomycetota bacterium]
MLGLVRRISEQRHRLILSRAEPFLEEDEVVVQWVRARRTDGGGAGFIFLTDQQCVLVWTSKADDDVNVRWEDLSSWGFKLDAKGGPLVGVETEHHGFFAQVVAATGRMAEDVGSFIRRFSYLAGDPQKLLTHPDHGPFHHHSSVHIDAEKKSIGGLTKRFM